jgi:hypothetical protein
MKESAPLTGLSIASDRLACQEKDPGRADCLPCLASAMMC